jgi:RHS repeat-associated protein
VGSEGIAGAGFSATYSYDNLGRISSASVLDGSGASLAGAAQGTYTYDATHVHGVSSVGTGATGYAASYDAAGNETCRAVGVTTCGAGNEQLGYDALGELLTWQNASGASEQYAYDGSGQRVWQQASSTSGGTTTTTTSTYVLGVEEVTTTAVTGQQPTTNTTSYYGLPGGMSASRDSSGLVVQGSDLLGTPVVALNLANGLVGEQLRTPYGQARFAAAATTGGGMHTSFGFTGQREDTQAPGSSGLDYFNARYFDPVVGRFTSADPTRPEMGSPWGTDAYGYVGGAVESATDPSGLAEVPVEIDEVGQQAASNQTGGAGSGGPNLGTGLLVIGVNLLLLAGMLESYIAPAYHGPGAATSQPPAIDRGAFNNSVTASEDAKFEAGAINSSTPLPDYVNSHVDPRPDKPKPTEPDKPKPGTSGSGQPPISNRPTQLGNCECPRDADGRPLNSSGNPYPHMFDLRTGEEVPFPDGSVRRVPKEQWQPVREAWDKAARSAYRTQWYDWFKDRGLPYPEVDWDTTDIHHILPVEFGGQNVFDNLVPIPRDLHNGPEPYGVTQWWNHFPGC